MELKFVTAQSSDFPVVVELLQIAARHLKESGVDQWSYWLQPPEDKLQWVQQGVDAAEFTLVYSNSILVGMYRLMKEDIPYWGKQDIAAFYIHSLVIHPDYTGNRIGVKLMKAIEKKAASHRIGILRLDCLANNEKLCSYYKGMGFKPVGTVHMPHSTNQLFEKHL
ncbi:hypothetical protein AAT17_10480 [Nonlabens sp. MIC269]|uniref:GNAT family N-acetyltransferase n=1 Tax=Nonlabens sp. MIC269 TaxID=1476901 RepID=UPI000720E9FF|nr:GNAT family N-acetyltransferase [Nonlabens sp. MIC269]ALM21631.1 hypothetical protein AAT17_10480 [Nonlabens sp. MIC269]